MAKNPINNTIEFTRNHLGRTVADTIAHSLHREYLNAVLPWPGELPSKSGPRANAGGVVRPEIANHQKPRAGTHAADHVVSQTEPV